MISLSGPLDHRFKCVHHNVKLDMCGWMIPGMRCLAELSCPACGRAYYGDLPVGQALASPMLLEAETGEVYDCQGTRSPAHWFADWLGRSFSERVDFPPHWSIETRRPPSRPLLLNCLNAVYGHSLLSLLNAQDYIDHAPDWDLIVLIPRQLRWLVPDGVSEIWSLPWSFRAGMAWNDGLARQIRERLARYEECALSIALPHPHPADWNIERFTGVQPFSPDSSSQSRVGGWGRVSGEPPDALPFCGVAFAPPQPRATPPLVTFVWRDDRCWTPDRPQNRAHRLLRRIGERTGACRSPQRIQQDRFVAIAEALRRDHPAVDMAILGLGRRQSGLPSYLADHRTTHLDEETERRWCARYARSHVVVGVHGSNMVLPSAHAGAVVQLLPPDRTSNLMQDILLSEPDPRRHAARCRFLPWETSPQTVAETVESVLALPNWIRLCESRWKSRNRCPELAVAPTRTDGPSGGAGPHGADPGVEGLGSAKLPSAASDPRLGKVIT